METKPVWEHEPARSTAHKDFNIYYDKPIPCGRYVEGGAIKPDIVLWDRQSKTAQIIEVSVPNDYGLNRAEREKNNKYQDLKNDLRTTWGLKEIELIPVIVGATGLVKTSLKQHPKSHQRVACDRKSTTVCYKRDDHNTEKSLKPSRLNTQTPTADYIPLFHDGTGCSLIQCQEIETIIKPQLLL